VSSHQYVAWLIARGADPNEARAEGKAAEKWLNKHGVSPQDSQVCFAALMENADAHAEHFGTYRPSKIPAAEQQPRWEARNTERTAAMRRSLLEEHGADGLAALGQRYQAMTTSLYEAIPVLGNRAVDSGAALDARMVNALGRYTPAPTEPEPPQAA
jgi:hypothetical protein